MCKNVGRLRDIPHFTKVKEEPGFANARLKTDGCQICLCQDDHLEIGGSGLRVVIESQPKDIEIPIKLARIPLTGSTPGLIEFDLELDDPAFDALDNGMRYFFWLLSVLSLSSILHVTLRRHQPPAFSSPTRDMLPTVPLEQQPPVLTFPPGTGPVGSNFLTNAGSRIAISANDGRRPEDGPTSGHRANHYISGADWFIRADA